MSEHDFRCACFVLVLVLACNATTCLYAAEPPRDIGVPQSCGVQLKTHNFAVDDLDRVHAAGFRVVRRGFYWNRIEKEKGVYDFSDYDYQMGHAKKLGLTVVGCLFGNNKLYEDDGQHNSEEFAEEYTALVKETASAMLKADPDCYVMAGSVSNYWEPSYEWTESCFKQGILKTGIRGWSVHPYGVKTPEEFAVGHRRMRELLEQYDAPDMPLLNTERGFAVKETYEGWSGGSKERARDFQAWNFVRQTMIDQLCGVRLTVWYQWDGEEFGLVDRGDTRPVYAACREMFEQLDGYRVVRRIDSDADLDYVLLFENEDGDRKLVAWTAPPPGGAPDEAKPHHAAIHTSESLAAVDPNGKPAENEAAVSPIRVTLTGAPQYVAVPDDVEFKRCLALGPVSVAQEASSPRTLEIPATAVDLKLCE